MEFELLKKDDRDIPTFQELHEYPTIKKYISIGENYFEYVTSTENVWYYKMLLEDMVIGGIHLEKEGDTMYLSICIHPQYQGKGYGKKSLRYVMDRLAKGVSSIKASIEAENISSIKLFESCGFVFVDREEELLNYIKILD